MNAIRTMLRNAKSTIRSFLPSEKEARRTIARRFAASVSRKPVRHAPGLWPWATRSLSF
jgi:hypothetical protein